MKRCWIPIACLSLAPLAGAERADVEAVPELSIRADVPEIAVDPRPPGRRYVILPELSYRFQLEPRCPAGFRPAFLSLGIADTRSRIPADGDGIEAELTVPAAQLAPLPLADFCELPAADAGGATDARPGAQQAEGAGRLEVGAALSAQASLTCADGERERITFVSTPLALTLVCGAVTGDGGRD